MNNPFTYFLVSIFVLSGCVTPTHRIETMASKAGLQKNVILGDLFDHLMFTKPQQPMMDGAIHVYIEGDGSPWISGRWVAEDPTPRHPLMLGLMLQDSHTSIYLGRPCYFNLKRNCRPIHWTHARYSNSVIKSMMIALEAIRRKLGESRPVIFLGHSGGGVIAMLLAARTPNVIGVVTIAANLDIDAWTQYHGYAPLRNSLNPHSLESVPGRIKQLHLVGGKDDNVPEWLVRPTVEKQINAKLLLYPSYNHRCCWEREWRSILDRL